VPSRAGEPLIVEVGCHGAFSVNGVGLNGAPFPLSFSVREAGSSWMVEATAAQAGELADVRKPSRCAGKTCPVPGRLVSV
jgi:hypothetical protein